MTTTALPGSSRLRYCAKRLRKHHRLVLAGGIGELQDAHLLPVRVLRSWREVMVSGQCRTGRSPAALTAQLEIRPALDAHLLQRRLVFVGGEVGGEVRTPDRLELRGAGVSARQPGLDIRQMQLFGLGTERHVFRKCRTGPLAAFSLRAVGHAHHAGSEPDHEPARVMAEAVEGLPAWRIRLS